MILQMRYLTTEAPFMARLHKGNLESHLVSFSIYIFQQTYLCFCFGQCRTFTLVDLLVNIPHSKFVMRFFLDSIWHTII